MERDSAQTSVPKNLQFRVGLLVGLAVVLGAGFVIYALYARGLFEDTQRLTLVAENAEGVGIGMDLSFSGFPIGRVQRLALDEQGRARIDIDVPRKDAHWLRETAIFTLARGLVGAARMRSGNADRPRKLVATLDHANAILASVDSLVGKTDKLVLKTEERLFAQGGVMDGTARAVEQLNSLLTDVRDSLKRADRILADTEATSGNAKAATTDLR